LNKKITYNFKTIGKMQFYVVTSLLGHNNWKSVTRVSRCMWDK